MSQDVRCRIQIGWRAACLRDLPRASQLIQIARLFETAASEATSAIGLLPEFAVKHREQDRDVSDLVTTDGIRNNGIVILARRKKWGVRHMLLHERRPPVPRLAFDPPGSLSSATRRGPSISDPFINAACPRPGV